MEVQHIIEAALEKCISTYDEVEREAGQSAGNGSDYGKFPGAILIKYGEGSMRKAGYLMTEIRKMWYYTKGNGSRFGRGFRYTVKELENVVTLCEEKILWKS